MDAPELNSPQFWEDDAAAPLVLANPLRGQIRNAEKLAISARQFPELAGHLLIETSGSSGVAPRFACIRRSAVRLSAEVVNEHLAATATDRWMCALPTFHVGGLGIYARASASGSAVVRYPGKWNACHFTELAGREAIRLTSLVPTQVVDLVNQGLRPPDGLRAVVVGGGHLPDSVYQAACDLAWPLLRSYGMTEAASQIATDFVGEVGSSDNTGLPILPHWQVRMADDGRLEIKGESLFSGYFFPESRAAGIFQAQPADGWFSTNDLGCLENGRLWVDGRVDRTVKVLGELVNLDRVEQAFRELFAEDQRDSITVDSISEQRRGSALVAIVEDRLDPVQVRKCIERHNLAAPGLEALTDMLVVAEIPRSALGKVRRRMLRDLARLR